MSLSPYRPFISHAQLQAWHFAPAMATFIACLGQALSPDGSVAELQSRLVAVGSVDKSRLVEGEYFSKESHGIIMLYITFTIWLFNIAMENPL